MGSLILALLMLSSAARAGEDDDARARALFQSGAVLYDEGRYEEAVAAFEEAYRLSARPALLFNIANALERLGRWDEALDVLSRYRAYARPDERETLDRRIGSLQRRIAEAATAPPAPPPPAPTSVVAPVVTAPDDAPTLFRPAPIGLASAGLALTGVGAALGVASTAAGESAAGLCAPDDAGRLRCSASAAGALTDEAGMAVAADVLVGVGIAGLGAGVALALWGDGGPLTVGPGFVAVQGSF